jgi:hypothetical protein
MARRGRAAPSPPTRSRRHATAHARRGRRGPIRAGRGACPPSRSRAGRQPSIGRSLGGCRRARSGSMCRAASPARVRPRAPRRPGRRRQPPRLVQHPEGLEAQGRGVDAEQRVVACPQRVTGGGRGRARHACRDRPRLEAHEHVRRGRHHLTTLGGETGVAGSGHPPGRTPTPNWVELHPESGCDPTHFAASPSNVLRDTRETAPASHPAQTPFPHRPGREERAASRG